jgi:hypothetical protein
MSTNLSEPIGEIGSAGQTTTSHSGEVGMAT